MSEDYFSNRNHGYRILVQTVDDTGTEQYVTMNGRDGEQFTNILRVQPHGFSSSPPKDSHALAIPLGGHTDLLLIVGGEDPNSRPKNLAQGDTIIYNATTGTTITMQGNKILVHAPGDINITAVGNLNIKAANIGLDGHVYLGGPVGSGVPASMQGTVDSAGDSDESNLATKVNVT